MTDLYRDMKRVLEFAADAAPEPAPDFLAGVSQRRRRRYRRGLVTGCALAVSAAALWPLLALPRASDDVASATGVALRPAGDIWPGAMRALPHSMPREFADERSPQWIGGTGDGRYLFQPFQTFAHPRFYDPATRAIAPLSYVDPPRADEEGHPAAVAEGYLTWLVTARDSNRAIYVAALPNGPARRIAIPATRVVAGPYVAGGQVLWEVRGATREQTRGGGIYRVAVGGGIPALVPGSEGWLLGDGGWAYRTGERAPSETWNLLTGERVTPRLGPGVDRMQCSIRWCVGWIGAIDRYPDQVVVQRIDGTGLRPAPEMASATVLLVRSGRFLLVLPPPLSREVPVIWDLDTNTAGYLHNARLDNATSATPVMVRGRGVDGTDVVFDLAAIR